jgi:hypothetical protein
MGVLNKFTFPLGYMTMNKKKIAAVIALVLLLAFLFLAFNLSNYRSQPAIKESRLSLSTNKTPIYDKAPYPVIDFFERQEDITLFTNTTYGGMPVPNTLVSLQVYGPSNKFENITFSQIEVTNSSGIGSWVFRIPSPILNHTEVVFGNWTAVAQARIGNQVLNNTRTFLVSWPVEILSVRTVDANRIPRTVFQKKGDIGLEVVLRNNDVVPLKTVLKGNVFDNLSIPVGHVELSGIEVPSGSKVTVYTRLTLDNQLVSFSGGATVWVGAYDEKGIPYSPSATCNFVLWFNALPINILQQDVALLSLTPSTNDTNVGTPVALSVVVGNFGNSTQNSTVVIYDNEFPIATMKVTSIYPFTERTLDFTWNTSKASYGLHSLRAYIVIVPWETHLTDNTSPTKSVTLALPSTAAKEGLPRALFLILLFIILLFLTTLLALILYRRRKEPLDPTEMTFFFLLQ